MRCRHPRMGCRKLFSRLQQDHNIGRDRFFALMRKHKLLIPRKRIYRRTTDSNHLFTTYKNELKDAVINRPHQAWVSDITYIRLSDRFAYLSLVTDAYSRKIVGWSLHPTLELDGVYHSAEKALKQLPKNARPIHHSDRGIQYCCHAYIRLLKKHKISISMTEENHCYENSMAERVNGILKHEYGLRHRFNSYEEALEAVREAINLYNNDRPHLCLGFKTPDEVHLMAA